MRPGRSTMELPLHNSTWPYKSSGEYRKMEAWCRYFANPGCCCHCRYVPIPSSRTFSPYETYTTAFSVTNPYTNLFIYEHFPSRTASVTTFFHYEPFQLRTFSVTNLFRYEPFPLRTFSVTNFSRYELYPIRTFCVTNLLRYELKSIRTLSHTNLCIRTFAYEPFTIRTLSFTNFRVRTFYIRTFSVTNILHTNFFRYEHFTYEPYTIRTFSITNFSRYEHFTVRTLSHTNLCLRTLAYEPFPIRTLCLRTSVLEAAQRAPPSCGFFANSSKYWEFRFETCHTSPGNNFTPCVKKLGPRS